MQCSNSQMTVTGKVTRSRTGAAEAQAQADAEAAAAAEASSTPGTRRADIWELEHCIDIYRYIRYSQGPNIFSLFRLT